MSKEGYLIKEGYNVKNWKKRWFILGKATLSYYSSQKSLKKVLGIIDLSEINEISQVHNKKKDFCLQIATSRRVYYVVADNQDHLEDWKGGIEKQCAIVQRRNIEPEKERQSETDDEKVNLKSFEMLTIIGQGSFGKVVQVRHKTTGDIFAMKVLNKKNIVDRGEVEHTRAEKNILMKINHPFLMKLHYSFQTSDKLYLVMDFINGGELFFHLQNDRRFTNERARFYAAQICLGISHLHASGIIYRDLKPENLLLDSSGNVKITDFGLSKEGLEGNQRTKTFCGTPEYLAPEVLDGKAYSKAVDWWSVGTLIFEMLTGLPPFYSEDVQKMYSMKLNAELTIPDYVEEEAQDIIFKFLDRNPETRLRDIEEIKKHVWFGGINWAKLLRKELPPPYIPEVSKESVSMIDESFTSMDVRTTVGDLNNEQHPTKPDQFEGFTFVPTKQ